VDDFLVVRNPDEASTLPYLVRLPLTRSGVVLKVRDTWPRTSKVYCHPATDWPAEPEVVERVAVQSCVRRGAAIDLVLRRGRENRSQFVFTRARGREVVFWQSARTTRQARPNVSLPTRRAAGQVLEILVDSHERYPWKFSAQQASTRPQALPSGDYAVALDGTIVASVERKSLSDLVSTLTTGKLRYVLAALAELPRAAVVVEDRYSAIFKVTHTKPAVVAEGLSEAQVRFPNVPIVFCETRLLAQEWAYRFLGAALAHQREHVAATTLTDALPRAGALQPNPATPAEVRAWALANGHDISTKGRIPASIAAAFEAARRTESP
jgi:hypothetical protein